MYKLLMALRKEFLLLIRDPGGLAILFVMPLVLIVTVTLIQDSAFKSVSNQIPVLLVNNDNGSVSASVGKGLKEAGAFRIVTELNGKKLNEESAREAVFKGEYQLAIVIPKDLSRDLQTKIETNVSGILTQFGLEDSTKTAEHQTFQPKEVKLYFDPAVQSGFKNAVLGNVDKLISQIETQSIYNTFRSQLGDAADGFQDEKFISFKEISPNDEKQETRPNSVQHNVPAWTLFAIFFIVIPLSINIVKEKTQGTYIRSRTNPGARVIVMLAKMITYLAICLLQFYMMIAAATLIFPRLGLPSLNIGGHLPLMSFVALLAGFAAVGFGILLGTIAKTQEQAAPFGATSAIILAAIGGVWVPVFAMPHFMQIVAKSSPMNWGLNAFYDVLLRSSGIGGIFPEAALLFLFGMATISAAWFYDKKKRSI